MGDFYNTLKSVGSVGDYTRLQEEFDLKKQQAAIEMQNAQRGGNLPAALQIANEYAKARAAGDTQRMNDIAISAKSFDRGVIYDQNGNPVAMGGYGDAVGSIAGIKKAYEANAQNASDLYYDPQTAGAEAGARLQQEGMYKPRIEQDIAQRKANVELGSVGAITQEKKAAELSADAAAAADKKAVTANSALGILDQAEQLLPKASGGMGGTVLSGAKGLAGYSDETTQTNEQLKLLSGWLVSNVPRMEGPQSNFDVQNYKTMAADLGNTMKPIGDRLAALQGLRALQGKYANPQNPPSSPSNQGAPKKGDVIDGYLYLGGDLNSEKSYKKVK